MGLTRVILSRELSSTRLKRSRRCRIWKSKFSFTVRCAWPLQALPALGYINKRDPNRGTCTNACRWEYNVGEGKEDMISVISSQA